VIIQRFVKDDFGKEILIRDDNYQIMMEWEKPYMESIIDEVSPKGDVLEIGFGCGYSATRIQSYSPASHTIIECDPYVIERAKIWAQEYKNITIIENTWQKSLHTTGKFDFIFFDDYPIEALERTQENVFRNSIQDGRLYMFIDICIDLHMNDDAVLSSYMSTPTSLFEVPRWRGSVINNPRIEYTEKIIDIAVPENCNYFSGNKAVIPIIRKKS